MGEKSCAMKKAAATYINEMNVQHGQNTKQLRTCTFLVVIVQIAIFLIFRVDITLVLTIA